MKHRPVFLSEVGMTCAAGDGPQMILGNLRAGCSPGMVTSDRWMPGCPVVVGEVSAALPDLASFPREYHTRNNRLALHSSTQIAGNIRDAVSTFGAERVGVVIGSTTSGMAEAESAFQAERLTGDLSDGFFYAHMELGLPAEFLAFAWGLNGPTFTVSTACSSSAKAFATARRLLRLGACDAVLVGGVDTLCRFTLRGFASLGALSNSNCLPFSPNRKGINIGEAGSFFIMRHDKGTVALLGIGETSDAYNISSPQPAGSSAQAAMIIALRDAGLNAHEVDYVNLHGTGTLQNDSMEAIAMRAVFPNGVACSSTKPLTGHTLGAAGALEAGICSMLLADGGDFRLPMHVNDGVEAASLCLQGLVGTGHLRSLPIRYCLSNVFGFGGTNVSVLLGAI